jgi:sugar phosphate isomerase/epimerase
MTRQVTSVEWNTTPQPLCDSFHGLRIAAGRKFRQIPLQPTLRVAGGTKGLPDQRIAGSGLWPAPRSGTCFFISCPALLLIFAATRLLAADASLGVFDNGLGRGIVSIDDQAELARKTGYDGVLFAGTARIPEMRKALESRGLKFYGIYTGMNVSDKEPGCDPGLPEAIRQLRGSGALITFNINGHHPDGDAIAVRVIRQVADMAAESGLRVALYPHYGMHMARIEDALRLREMAGKTNVGIVFNLCHWLRSGDEANMTLRLRQSAKFLDLVLINGADHEGDWDRLIQPLDRGEFDVHAFLKALHGVGYRGPTGLQCYAIKGDREENLLRSMAAWKKLSR